MEIYIEKKVRRDFRHPNGRPSYGVHIQGNEYVAYFKEWLRIEGVYEFGLVTKSDEPLNRQQLTDALLSFIKETPELEVHNSRGSNWLDINAFATAVRPRFEYFDSWFNEMGSYREWMFFHSGKEWEATYRQLKELDRSVGLKNVEVEWNTDGVIPRPTMTSNVLDRTAIAVFGNIKFTITYNDHYLAVSNVFFGNGIEAEFDESKLEEKVRAAIIDRSDQCSYDVRFSTEQAFMLDKGYGKYLQCYNREEKVLVKLKLSKAFTTERVVLKAAHYAGKEDGDNVAFKGALLEEVRYRTATEYTPYNWRKAVVMEAGENWLSHELEFDISDFIK